MSRKAFGLAVVAVLSLAISCGAQSSQSSESQPPHEWLIAKASSPAEAGRAQASASADQAQLLKITESFVRKLFAWGPNMKVTLGQLSQSPSPDFYAVPLTVTQNDQSESGVVFVSKDGKTLLRGDIFDMSKDPFASNRAKIHTEGDPSRGPADARITVVEFSDFECPHCAQLYESMKEIEPRYPQVRVVYKYFPLTNIHPWAETAAVGAQCAYKQSPEAFWKMYDSIFSNQDLISPENVWDKLTQFASQAGLNTDTFKVCLSSDEAKKAVDEDHQEGIDLGVNSTPTLYINGRPLVGGDPQFLEQYIDFELASHGK
jgi:protein-disulfide isomerase